MYFNRFENRMINNSEKKSILNDKEVYVWSCNKGSMDTFTDLVFNQVDIQGFVTDDHRFVGQKLINRQIFDLDGISKSGSFIVTSDYLSVNNERKLQDYCYYRKSELIPPGINAINYDNGGYLFQKINERLVNKERIRVYSENEDETSFLKLIFKTYDIPVYSWIKSFSDLYQIGPDEMYDLYIISEKDKHKRYEIMNLIESIGVEDSNICSIQEYKFTEHGNDYHYPDPLLGITDNNDSKERMYPGWRVYGSETEESLRIMVLGGSTSTDGLFRPESWVKKLYRICRKNHLPVCLYNGAHSDSGVVEEMLRYLRDGYYFRPDIVISMSGYNDMTKVFFGSYFYVKTHLDWIKALGEPEENIIGGIGIEESRYSFWLRNEKMLKAIVEANGADFFSFLQPINACNDQDNLKDKLIFEVEGNIDGMKSFRSEPTEEEFYFNLKDMFIENVDESFIDCCHYSEIGNERVAQKVFDIISGSERFKSL